MIKGDVKELVLMMDSEEVKALVKQCNEAEIINLMGKRYIICGVDCAGGVRVYSGEYKTKVTINLQAIKKGV